MDAGDMNTTDTLRARYEKLRQEHGYELSDATGALALCETYSAAHGDASPLLELLAGLPKEPTPDQGEECALVVAATQGSLPAQRRLETEYFARIPAFVASMKLGDALVDDVAQDVRQKLLVGEPPKILAYVGRGSLAALIRVTATRTAISTLRKGKRETQELELDRAIGELDPERRHLKDHYRGLFRESFAAAVQTLDPRERNMLRLHFLQKVTLQQLASMYGIHRATVVRQLAAIREKIAKGTRSGLKSHGAVGATDLESIVDLLKSRFDVSVEGLLASMSDHGDSNDSNS
ncbi:MAG: sigma-70 family RNA polymerase sigma factor [Polyangiales bacterium]